MRRLNMEYFIYGLVFLVPLLFIKQLADFYVIKYYVVQGALLLFLAFYCFKTYVVKVTRLLYVYIAFLASILVSTVYSHSPAYSLKHFYFHLTGVLSFIVMLTFLSDGDYFRKLKNIVIWWLFASTIACLYGVVQYSLGQVPYSTLGNKNIFSAFIIMGIPVLVCLLVEELSDNDMSLSALSLISLLIVHIMALYVTESRAAFVGCLVSCMFLLLLLSKDRKQLHVRGIVLLGGIAVCFFLLKDIFIQSMITDIRFYVWRGALKLWESSPWLGVGAGTFFLRFYAFCPLDYYLQKVAVTGTRHAHSEYLEVLTEQGIIGLMIFLALVACVVVMGIRRIRMEKNRSVKMIMAGMLSGFVALAIQNIFSINLRFPSSLLFFYMLPACWLAKKELKEIRIFKQVMIPALVGYAVLFYFFTIHGIIANYFFKQGIVARNKGDFKTAVTCYKESLKSAEIVKCREMLAFAYAHLGLLVESYEQYQLILAMGPELVGNLRNAGIIAAQLNETDKALSYFKKAVTLNQYDVLSRESLIALYQKLGLTEEARLEIKRLKAVKRFLAKK